MPPDPRIYRGPRGETQRDFYGSFYVPPEKQYVEDSERLQKLEHSGNVYIIVFNHIDVYI